MKSTRSVAKNGILTQRFQALHPAHTHASNLRGLVFCWSHWLPDHSLTFPVFIIPAMNFSESFIVRNDRFYTPQLSFKLDFHLLMSISPCITSYLSPHPHISWRSVPLVIENGTGRSRNHPTPFPDLPDSPTPSHPPSPPPRALSKSSTRCHNVSGHVEWHR